jgi:hypothetical protein
MTNNIDVRRLTTALTIDESGTIRPTKRFTGGAFNATRKVSPTLLKPDSFYRRLLATLASCQSPISPKELTKRFNEQYSQTKTQKSIGARLGELFVYGLVGHVDVNKNGGLWFIKPDIDAFNTPQIVSVAMFSLEGLRQKTEVQESKKAMNHS